MDHTGIDYPIVQGEDNFEYLDKDPLGNPEISGSIFWTGRIIGSLQIHIWYLWGIICRQEKCSVIWINIVMKHFSRKIQLGKFICRTGCCTWKQLAFLTVDAYDKYIYRTQWDNVSERQELLKRIYEQAPVYNRRRTYDGRIRW